MSPWPHGFPILAFKLKQHLWQVWVLDPATCSRMWVEVFQRGDRITTPESPFPTPGSYQKRSKQISLLSNRVATEKYVCLTRQRTVRAAKRISGVSALHPYWTFTTTASTAMPPGVQVTPPTYPTHLTAFMTPTIDSGPQSARTHTHINLRTAQFTFLPPAHLHYCVKYLIVYIVNCSFPAEFP